MRGKKGLRGKLCMGKKGLRGKLCMGKKRINVKSRGIMCKKIEKKKKLFKQKNMIMIINNKKNTRTIYRHYKFKEKI